LAAAITSRAFITIKKATEWQPWSLGIYQYRFMVPTGVLSDQSGLSPAMIARCWDGVTDWVISGIALYSGFEVG
jgi:hypothetical protein